MILNSMKYLILGFKGAKFFTKNKFSKDRSFDNVYNTKTERKDVEIDEKPVTYRHVSNVLHVLFCERPKSKHRYSCYDMVDRYNEMAKNSLIRYTTIKFDKKDGESEFPTRKMVIQKCMYNSHSKPVITWFIINDYIGDSLFLELSNIITELGFDMKSQSAMDVCQVIDLDNVKLKGFFDILIKNSRKALVDFFNKRGINQTITNNYQTRHTEIKAVDNVTVIDGEIAIPLSNDDINRLREYSGSPTILDGGMVYVKGIVDYYEFSSDDYTPSFERI